MSKRQTKRAKQRGTGYSLADAKRDYQAHQQGRVALAQPVRPPWWAFRDPCAFYVHRPSGLLGLGLRPVVVGW